MNTQVPLWVTLLSVFIAALAVLVSAMAIYFTRKNLFRQFIEQRASLDKQLRIQLATTIDKEWIENLRKVLAEFLKPLWQYYKTRSKPNSDDKTEIQIQDMIDEMMYAKDKCALLLDISQPSQKKVMDILETIFAQVTVQKNATINMNQLRKDFFEALHQLVASKHPKDI
jgi:hypothetical protein